MPAYRKRKVALISNFLIALCVVVFLLVYKPQSQTPQEITSYTARALRSVPPEKNCTEPAIDEFPDDFFSQHQRLEQAGIIIHVLIAFYMFSGLAIVCDDYFVSSLESICESLKMKPDVAGATFMAAGSSAPELFASVIGVFITKGDIGLGTIVGSAVFNILFIVSLCGLFVRTALQLTAWPLIRDSGYYMLSVGALIAVTYDRKVRWFEAMILVLMYVIYIVIMYFNSTVENWIDRRRSAKAQNTKTKNNEEQGLLSDATDDDVIESPFASPKKEYIENLPEHTVEEPESPFAVPKSFLPRCLWLLNMPLIILMYLTIPDCRKPRLRKLYMLTFIMSVVWIAGLSYVLVWMVAVIGFTFGLPDVIMGLTFLAAGTSVPDAISSIIVARHGEGDMAVSNAVGSNIFDVLLCLGIPWLLQTTIVEPGGYVAVYSGSIIYSSISLFGTVCFTLLVIHMNDWKLNKCLGLLMQLLYWVFISVATCFELNLFGNFNLPTCKS